MYECVEKHAEEWGRSHPQIENKVVFVGQLCGKSWSWETPRSPEWVLDRVFKINRIEEQPVILDVRRYTPGLGGHSVIFGVTRSTADKIHSLEDRLKAGVWWCKVKQIKDFTN